MFDEKMKLTASLSTYERMELIGEDLTDVLQSLPDLEQVEYSQGIVHNMKDGTSRKIVSATVDYPEKLTEENVQSLAEYYGVKIVWRRKVYG